MLRLQELSLDLKDLLAKLLICYLSAISPLGDRQLEQGSRQYFARLCSRQAVESCGRFLHTTMTLLFSLPQQSICLYHSFASFTFKPTFLYLLFCPFIYLFTLHSFCPRPHLSSIIYLINILLTFFPRLLLKL